MSCDDYRTPGAMAEYVAVPERILYKLPDTVTYAQAAVVEPLSVAVHAVAVSRLRLGDRAVIVGAGTIGLLLTQVVKAAGVTELIVADLDEDKLKVAERLGATCVVNSSKENVAAVVAARTDGRGADIAFEAVGITATLNTAIDSVRTGGSVVMVGNIAQKTELPLQKCVTRQIDLQGSCASSGEYDVCLNMIGHKMVDADSIISKVVPLAQGGEWFDRLHDAEPGLIKVVLEP